MSMPEIRLTRTVAAPPAVVWEVITDLGNAVSTLSGLQSLERLDGTGYEVGTRWRETRVMFGKAATEEMWVTEVEPERRTVVAASSHGADYRSGFTLEPAGDGTELTITFSATVSNPSLLSKIMMKAFGALGAKASAKALQKDLDDIAAAAERRAGKE